MKKLLFVLILVIAFAGSLFAWDPSFLTKFPPVMKDGDKILNLGIGFDYNARMDEHYRHIFPLHVSLDFNVGIGDIKLPFFFGGLVSYVGYGYKFNNVDWFYHKLRTGGRAGYHFNWGVDRLDTYAVTTIGWTFYLGDGYGSKTVGDHIFYDVHMGARWFFTDWFGVWLEAGWSSTSIADIGVMFKF